MEVAGAELGAAAGPGVDAAVRAALGTATGAALPFGQRFPDGTLPLPFWLQPPVRRPATRLVPEDGPECCVPYGLQLYDFQKEGARFLAQSRGALLVDEMGLGKSIQAIVAARWLFHRGQLRRALVLCPKTLVWDWYRKLRRWAPDLALVAIQGHRSRREYEWCYRADLFVAGYETWREDGAAVPHQFDLVILDEVQRIKNQNTLLARAVERLQPSLRWGLSGTPMENSVQELLTIMGYIQPQSGLTAGTQSPQRLREAIRPYVLRRRKADVLKHLPPKLQREIWLDLHPAQRRQYEAAEAAALQGVLGAGEPETGHLLALLTRLKQICNLCSDTGESCKLEFLVRDLAAILPRGEKVLVFSQYPEVTLRRLLPRLAPFQPALFSGELSQWQRESLLESFEEADAPRVLLMSLKAGGVGLTLTRANHVYHFDPWWNPAAAQQAEDRTHRIGQHRPVYVTTLLTRHTVEERVAAILATKRELFSAVIDQLEKPALGRRELLSILGFRPGLPH